MLSGLSNIPPITSITVNDTILRDVDLAELVSESFSRVADDLPPFAFNPIPVSDVPDEYIISPEAVELALSAVHERKSVEPDEIPNWLLKTCAPIISNPVCDRFITLPSEKAMFLSYGKVRMSFHLGRFPNLSVSTPTLDLYP